MEETKKAVVTGNEGYDAHEVDTTDVGIVLALIVAVIIGVFLFVTFFYDRFYAMLYRERVEEAPSVQLDAVRAREKVALGEYGVIDASKGQYRIPIARAKQLLLDEVAAGKPPYPIQDQAVKPDPLAAAPAAAGGAAAPAANGTAPAVPPASK